MKTNKELEKMIADLCVLRSKVKKMESEPEVQKYKKAEEAIKVLTDSIKVASAPYCESGKTVNIVDWPAVAVTITGPLATPEYDLKKAMNEWPSPIMYDVCSIDRKKVEALITLGKLPADAAKRAELAPVPLSPRVTIKFK